MKSLSIIFLLVVFASCTVIGNFEVKKSGAMHVNFWMKPDQEDGEDYDASDDSYTIDSLTRDWKSPYCKNFELTNESAGVKWSFDLDTPEELSMYFREKMQVDVKFTKTKKEFIIDGEDGNHPKEKEEDYKTEYGEMGRFEFSFNFDQKVKSVSSDCDCAQKVGDNRVDITGNIYEILANGTKNIITIKLK